MPVLTLTDIVESPEFVSRVKNIRNRSFRSLRMTGSLDKVPEYGFKVGTDGENLGYTAVVRGTENQMPFFQVYEHGLTLIDTHSHKIIGSQYFLPPSYGDVDMASFDSVVNAINSQGLIKDGQVKHPQNPKLWDFSTDSVKMVLFFYNPETIGVTVIRCNYEKELKTFWGQMIVDLTNAGISEEDFRRESGVVAQCGYLSQRTGFVSAFYKLQIDNLRLPESANELFPIVLPSRPSSVPYMVI